MSRSGDRGGDWAEQDRLKKQELQRRTTRRFQIVQKEEGDMAHNHGKGDWSQFRRDLKISLRQIEQLHLADEMRGTEIRALQDAVLQLKRGKDWTARLMAGFGIGIGLGASAGLVWLLMTLGARIY